MSCVLRRMYLHIDVVYQYLGNAVNVTQRVKVKIVVGWEMIIKSIFGLFILEI